MKLKAMDNIKSKFTKAVLQCVGRSASASTIWRCIKALIRTDRKCERENQQLSDTLNFSLCTITIFFIATVTMLIVSSWFIDVPGMQEVTTASRAWYTFSALALSYTVFKYANLVAGQNYSPVTFIRVFFKLL